MKKLNLSGKDIRKLGYKDDHVISFAKNIMMKYFKRRPKVELLEILEDLIKNPKKYESEPHLNKIVEALNFKEKPIKKEIRIKKDIQDYIIYGKEEIEAAAIHQMDTAMRLPISVKGALMPDAHQGYGLPIGGVIATDGVVIPYGVGMDIGCRMCLSVYPISEQIFRSNKAKLKNIIVDNTRFGRAEFKDRMEHEVLERKEFKEIKFLHSLHKKAWAQLGTSGHGNHFVDLGVLEIGNINEDWELEPGKYFAILSHSGSRGMGAEIARHYTRVAKEVCLLPKGAKELAWLDMNSQEGQEYWAAMNLAGDYATANHQQIHFRLSKAIGEKPILKIENHHNFAWKEKIGDNYEVIVHRKGATPAYKSVYGIIPGSMATPAFIVKGKGNEESIESASHGAGRVMSRAKAKASVSDKEMRQILEKADITLMGGGLDESPQVYKDIHKVMSHQKDLVEVKAIFYPKIVRME